MDAKKGFILYADLINVVNKLPLEKRGELFTIILDYVNGNKIEIDDLSIDLVFESIKLQLDRDKEKWQKTKETKSHNGKLGNLKKYNPSLYKTVVDGNLTLDEALELARSLKNSQTSLSDATRSTPTAKPRTPIVNDSDLSQDLANVAVNVNDNVNDNVNVKVTATANATIPSEKEFLEWIDKNNRTEKLGKKLFSQMQGQEWKTAKNKLIDNWKSYCNSILNSSDWDWGYKETEEYREMYDIMRWIGQSRSRTMLEEEYTVRAIEFNDESPELMKKLKRYLELKRKLKLHDNDIHEFLRYRPS